MNTNDIYVPIDISAPIKTAANIRLRKHSNNNTVLLFQLVDKCKPVMLTDATKISIAFTNTRGESVSGSGTLQVVNPYRGTISYELCDKDLTMSGLNTITLGVTTGSSFFTVQCVAMCQDTGDTLYDALQGFVNGSGSSTDTSVNSSNNTLSGGASDFPCSSYDELSRICRRCQFMWYNNTFPKPVSFNSVKLCQNSYGTSTVPNFANLEGYEKAFLPTVTDSEGYLGIVIDGVTYICDTGKDGSVYLRDKTTVTPLELVGLYVGKDLVTYYKTSEKLNNTDTFDVNSLFD